MIELLSLAFTSIVLIVLLFFQCCILIFTILYYIYKRNSKIIFPSVIIKIFLLFESQITNLYRIFKLSISDLNLFVVDTFNKYFLNSFCKTKRRVLFLPQCLRNSLCKAPTTPKGIICLRCNQCIIPQIYKIASDLKYRVYVVTGGTMVKRIISEVKPEGIIGVGCLREVLDGLKLCYFYKIPAQGVVLLKDGCIETVVDLESLINKLKLGLSTGS